MSGNELLLLSFTAITAVASLITASVAGWNARTAAREYRWARRPFLRVDWVVRGRFPHCVVREIANRPTTLHYIEISVSTLPARSRSKSSHAPFQVVHTNRMPNLSLLADKATHTVPLYVPVREDTQPTTCVVLTASAGGPPLTQHYYTDFRYRTSDSAWQIDNNKPFDIPSPTFFSAVTDRFWDWWRDLHANNG